MTKLTLAAVLIGLFLFLGSCARNGKGAPSTIYPDPIKDPGAYIDSN